ncbi:MAG: VTT domain-containing protein [Acidobacteriia bacterium]|nr:VTT domain-containing protein [Terriglobia bacterium]
MIGSLEHFFHFLFNVQGLIEWGGTLLVCVIVFIETGFFVGFFLPGDSLLVTAGVFAATGHLHLAELLALVPLCAIVGDQIGYWIGRKAGQALYRRKDSLVFRRRHLDRAHQFYEKYGGKTVILARFVPIVRTFCPPVAGAAWMPYGRYFVFDVAGGILWVGSMILAGYFLGSIIPNIGGRIHYVIGAVILLSLLPAIISVLRARSSRAPRVAPAVPVVQSEQE